MNDRTNTLGNWACLAVAVIVFGLLMGLRTKLQSEWLRAAAAGVAFALLFTTVNLFRKSKHDSGTQGASPMAAQPSRMAIREPVRSRHR